jgi:phage tail-like protein
MSEIYHPLVGFHFTVRVIGSGVVFAAAPEADAAFQEGSGISAQLDVGEVEEGGENRFVHRLPKHTKYTALVLKRGTDGLGVTLLHRGDVSRSRPLPKC